jgi:hypothetical protein
MVAMFDFDYPKVKQSLGRAALQGPYPAWFLDPLGVIYAANLMAFWLWDVLRPGEPIKPDSLLGRSIFDILVDNLERIPMDQNVELYEKRSAVVKRLYASSGLPLYNSFVSAMEADSQLAQIYERAVPNTDREWDYPLKILSPGQRTSPELLQFEVTNFRLEGDAGGLVVCTPTSTTLPLVEEQYSLLVSTYSGDKVYMLPDHMEERATMENNLLLTSLHNASRVYYPTLIQDTLWYIAGENEAHQLLVGGSTVGMHFFELFFAPQLREWLGPLQETSAPRALRYFDRFTAEFQREHHELHAEYEQLIKRLLQLPGFRDLLDISRRLTIYLNLPTSYGETFYTCRVLLPYPFSPAISLQFRSMVKFVHPGLHIHAGSRHYQLTLVPENNETDAALILLHLAATASELEDRSNAELKQLLWGLAITKTVEEGLTEQDGQDTKWEPETAFRGICQELERKFSPLTQDKREEILTELRVIIEVLDRKGIVDKGALLLLLNSLVRTRDHLGHLAKFLDKELEIHKRAGG